MSDTYTPSGKAGAIFVALDLANTFRLSLGLPLLDQLPVDSAIVASKTQCVLAKAFNCDCEISYDQDNQRGYVEAVLRGHGIDPERVENVYVEFNKLDFERGGIAIFGSYANDGTTYPAQQLAEQFAEESGMSTDAAWTDEPDCDGATWYVPIRDEITEIAENFDSGFGAFARWLDRAFDDDVWDAVETQRPEFDAEPVA